MAQTQLDRFHSDDMQFISSILSRASSCQSDWPPFIRWQLSFALDPMIHHFQRLTDFNHSNPSCSIAPHSILSGDCISSIVCCRLSDASHRDPSIKSFKTFVSLTWTNPSVRFFASHHDASIALFVLSIRSICFADTRRIEAKQLSHHCVERSVLDGSSRTMTHSLNPKDLERSHLTHSLIDVQDVPRGTRPGGRSRFLGATKNFIIRVLGPCLMHFVCCWLPVCLWQRLL